MNTDKLLEALKKKREEQLPSGIDTISKGRDKYTENFEKAMQKYNSGFTLDDIAPIKDMTATADKKRTWINTEAFDDGYQPFDILKTAGATAADIKTNVLSGILGGGEKVIDAGAGLLGKAAQSTPMDKMIYQTLADSTKGTEFSKSFDTTLKNIEKTDKAIEKSVGDFAAKDLYDEKKVANTIITKPLEKITGIDVGKYSLSGDKLDAVAESGGQLLTQIAASIAMNSVAPGTGSAVGMGLMGVTSFGSEFENALRSGATYDQALTSGLISAGAELATEKLGGISFGSKTLVDVIGEKATKRLGSKIGKALLTSGKIGANVTMEGVEELISGHISAAGQKLTYMSDKELDELFSNEDKLESFIGGVILGGFGEVGNVIQSKRNGVDYLTGEQANETKVIDKLYDDAIKDKDLTSKEKSQMRDKIVKQMENGEISTDTIESILGGEEYKAYKNAYDERNALRDELKDLRSMKQGDMTDIQIERMNELKGMNLDDTTAINDLRKKLDDKMKPLIQNRLSESYNEASRVYKQFDADLSKYKGKQRDSVERAIRSGVLNNTNRTHALVDFLSAIESRTGIQFDYTNNKRLAESGFAVAGRTVNAFEKNGTVTLNVNSAKSWQTAVGHDITHVLEGANNYDALKTAIYEYAESKGELESRRAEIEELYNGIEADIDKELTAELVGDYLFSDSKFIDKLAGNRTLFQKIYDEIKYLYKAATGKELTAIEKVKKEFDRTWKELEKKGAAEIVDVDGSTGIRLSKDISEYPYNIQTVIKEYMSSADESIEHFIKTFNSNNRFARHKISNVTENQATDIKRLLGIDVNGFTNDINTNAIRHIEKRHGKNGIADSSMSNISDIARIGYVLKNYDDVEIAKSGLDEVNSAEFRNSKNEPAPMLIFSKKINGTYYIAQAIPDSEYKKLWIVSAYISKKEAGTQALNTKNKSQVGMSLASSASDTTIPQKAQSVNTSISEKLKNDTGKAQNSLSYGTEATTTDSLSNFAFSAPIRSDIKPKTDTPNKDIAPVRKDIAPVRDDITPVREDIAPVAENATTTDSNFEAPAREDTTPAKDTPVANSVQETKQKISEEIKAIETEIANNEKFHEEVVNNYDEQIAKLREEHSALKNKKTKKAKDILKKISSIEALKETIDSDYEKRINGLKMRAGMMKSPGYIRAIQKRVKMQEHAQFAADLLGDTTTWVDKKTGLQYETNTERRNLRDIVRDENGKKDIAKADEIDDALNGQYNREEAAKQRELAEARGKYAEMDITSAEDAYIQMLGELRHNPDTTLKKEDVQNYYNKHKNKIDTEKVDKIIEMARKDYDSFLQRANEKLREQGMKEIPYRQGYFPHFTDTKQNFIQKLLNWKTQKTEIPTSIAGLTEEFNPNKKWQSFDKHRRTDKTDYSFMKGFDTYSDGVLDWIYHLDTIQKRRAVENYIRFIHSDEGVKQRIREIENDETIDGDEAQARIDAIKVEAQNPLNNFIQDFRTKTNILTGKKNSLDRGVEQKTSRSFYSVMTNVQNRVSGNLVAGNIRSALTNFIPITQSWAQVSPLRSLEAAKDTIKNAIQDDGLINKSTFLTNRLRQADKLYKTNWDKIGEKAGILFDVIDGISSQIIWRSKYNQNLANKMTEAEAIANADQFAENVMAGRSKGNEPTLFNAKSPLVKIFTAFQLEVNNQYGYFFKDVPNDVKAESKKWKGALVKGYTTAFVGAYVYNAIMEQITGSGAALDPIGIIAELLKDLFGDDDDKDYWEILENTGKNIAKELPLVGGILGGGRIPIANVFPYSNKGGVIESAKALYNDIEEGNGRNIGNELMNPVFSLVTPLGGGQIKKTIQGLNMFNTDEKHPIAGSYTGSGNLRFPVEDTPLNRVQAGLFGQYANKNAREYFDNGYAPLNDKQIQEFKDVDIPIKDYWEYREGLKEINSREGSTVGDKFDYVAGLDLPVSKKNILINNIVDRKDKVDLTDYDKFADYAEFDLFVKNRKMYDFLQENNIPFKNYITGEKGTKEAYSWAANNPEGYSLSKAVTDDITAYKAYTKALNNIEPDKNAKGEVIKDSRSKKVAAFVNSLNLSNEAKYILYKIEFKSYNAHNRDIVNYIEGRDDLSYNDKVNIYKKLGFTIENGRVYWD